MKRLILVILVSVSTFVVFSEDLFYVAGTMSYLPNLVMQNKPVDNTAFAIADSTDSKIFFEADILGGIQWKGLFAEAEVQTDMLFNNSQNLIQFCPYRVDFYVRVGYKIKWFKVEYEHLCVHGVDSRMIQGIHDKISISVDSRGFR